LTSTASIVVHLPLVPLSTQSLIFVCMGGSCLVANGLELELALENASCTTLKASAFEIGGPRLDSIFQTIKANGLEGACVCQRSLAPPPHEITG
jgi:hypothetical protein